MTVHLQTPIPCLHATGCLVKRKVKMLYDKHKEGAGHRTHYVKTDSSLLLAYIFGQNLL
jgi:hypothetical protein